MFHPFKQHKEVQHVTETIVIIEGERYNKHDNEGKELKIIKELVDIVEILVTPKKQKVKMVLTQTFNNNKFIIMSFAPLPANQKAPIQIALVDADTLQPVTATSANEIEVSGNLAVATVDASRNLVGVAPGSGNLTSVADWTYQDSISGQPVTVTQTVVTPFTVEAVVGAEKVQMVVTLGTPVAQ